MLRAAVATVVASSLTLLAAVGCGGAEQANVDRPGCGRIVPDAGDVVPDPPDGVSLCPAGVCNYQSQDGCAAGTACAPVQVPGEAAVEPGCVRAGTRATGDTCDVDNPCEAGSFCVNSGSEGSYCRKMCCGGDWSACDDGESCYRPLQLLVMGMTVPAEVSLCFPVGTCDVLSSATCNVQGYDCKMVDPTGQAACIPRSPEKLGDPCSSASACARGLTCVGEPGNTRCRRLCRAEACGTPSCPASEGVCVHFNRDPPFVGECTPGF